MLTIVVWLFVHVGEVLKSNAYMLIYEKNPAYTLETPFALGASGSDAPPLSM